MYLPVPGFEPAIYVPGPELYTQPTVADVTSHIFFAQFLLPPLKASYFARFL